MFIEFEETPNPNALKFLPGRQVLSRGVKDYRSAGEAEKSPLALRLFDIDGVEGVFLSGNYVSVIKDDASDWEIMKPEILTALMEHFTAGIPVVEEVEQQKAAEIGSEIERQIIEILDTRVKPAVSMDGGNIEFVEFTDGVVYLRMEGACAGCPSSTMTLKSGIENLLKHYVPEVIRVEQQAEF